MKKGQKIVISRVENGFTVTIADESGLYEYKCFVYNLYQDLVRDMSIFLKMAKYEDEVEEKESEEEVYDQDED